MTPERKNKRLLWAPQFWLEAEFREMARTGQAKHSSKYQGLDEALVVVREEMARRGVTAARDSEAKEV